MITQIDVASRNASSPLSHLGKANSTDLTRQLPDRITPGLQTPFPISALLQSTLKCSVMSHHLPSLRSQGACVCLPDEMQSSQQMRKSFPLLAPGKLMGVRRFARRGSNGRLITAERHRDTQACLKKQRVPQTHAEMWHCLWLRSLGPLPSSCSLMGDFKRLAAVAYTGTQR